MRRALLTRSSNLVTRQRVYKIADGLEVDDVDHYEVWRSRVLFEDVVLVTYHRWRGMWFLLITGLLAAAFSWAAWEIAQTEPLSAKIFLGVVAGPMFLAFLLRLILGVDEINVFSNRARARMRFWFRKQRARELMNEITSSVRRRQEAMSRASVAVTDPPETPVIETAVAGGTTELVEVTPPVAEAPATPEDIPPPDTEPVN